MVKKLYDKFTQIPEKQIRSVELSLLNQESTYASSHLEIREDHEEAVFSYSKIVLSKFFVVTLKQALENFKDPKQQFNALLLMDQFFQNLYGCPTLQNELEYYQQYK